MKPAFLVTSIFLVTLNLMSCKLNSHPIDAGKEVNGVSGIEIPAQRNMTASELEIGRRICSHLKKKRELFEKLDNAKEQFRFRAELKNCDGRVFNTDLFTATLSNANSTDLEYLASRENYFKDVVSDQSGMMNFVCEAITKTEETSNVFFVLSNETFKYVTTFLIKDGLDQYEITKAKKNASGTYDALSLESVSLISSNTQAADKFIGVEKERVRYTVCQDNKMSSMKQVWVEALTDFVVK